MTCVFVDVLEIREVLDNSVGNKSRNTYWINILETLL